MRRPAVAVGLGAAIALLVGSALIGVPFLTANRDYPASIPSPSPLFSEELIEVPPGEDACFRHAVAEEHSREARFRTAGEHTPPLRVTIAGPDYAQRADIGGGYQTRGEHRVAIAPPPRATAVRVCIENRGDDPVGLVAAADRAHSRSLVTVGDRRFRASLTFGFWETGIVDIRRRAPDIAERVAVFRPAFVTPALVGLLAALLGLGVPALLAYALWRELAAPGAELREVEVEVVDQTREDA